MARAGLGRHRAGEKGGNNGSRFVTSGMRVNNRKSFIDKSEKSIIRDDFHLHYQNLLILGISTSNLYPLIWISASAQRIWW
jgi:hypothetical protein